MTPDAAVRCEACHAPLLPDDRFCEECGARAGAEPDATDGAEVGCELCGAAADALDADGYCGVCGMRRRQPGSRVEVDLVLAAAVSDQGRVHHRNEDAFHLELVQGAVVAVVCDGISSSTASNAASRSRRRRRGRRARRGGARRHRRRSRRRRTPPTPRTGPSAACRRPVVPTSGCRRAR